MSLKLTDHLTHKITGVQLLDPGLRPAPAKLNPWALFCAWCFDWALALMAAHLSVSAWLGFMRPLGLAALPPEAHDVILAYSGAMRLILIPVFFFSLNFLGIALHGMTPGLRAFKHRVDSADLTTSLYWALGATVSSVALGMPVMNSWLDQFAGSETLSHRHHYWRFSRPVEPLLEVPDLVQEAQNNQPMAAPQERLAA